MTVVSADIDLVLSLDEDSLSSLLCFACDSPCSFSTSLRHPRKVALFSVPLWLFSKNHCCSNLRVVAILRSKDVPEKNVPVTGSHVVGKISN
jgi:hypothetical protein